MLLGLRHYAFVGSDYQKAGVYSADAGQHVLDKPLMARNVDDADVLAVWQGEPGKAEIDSHAALFFFAEAIRIYAGESLDERALAVIYVAGGTDDIHCVRTSPLDNDKSILARLFSDLGSRTPTASQPEAGTRMSSTASPSACAAASNYHRASSMSPLAP